MYGQEVLAKAAAEVASRKPIVFPVTKAKNITGLQISPIGVVEEKEKLPCHLRLDVQWVRGERKKCEGDGRTGRDPGDRE